MFPVSGAVADPTRDARHDPLPEHGARCRDRVGFDGAQLSGLSSSGSRPRSATNGIQIYQYTVELLSERN
jgi:hypothetical protein